MIIETTKSYKSYVQDAVEEMKKLSGVEKNNYLIKLLVYTTNQHRFLKEINSNNYKEQIRDLINFTKEKIKYADTTAWRTTDQNRKRYIIEVDTEGMYKLVGINEEYKIISVIIDGKHVNGTDKFFLEKGDHKVEISFSESDNLAKNNYINDNNMLINGEKISIPINRFNFSNQYHIKFDYKINEGEELNVNITQNNDGFDDENIRKKVIDSDLTADGRWHDFEYVFSPNYSAKEAFVNFEIPTFAYDKKINFDIKDFRVYEQQLSNIYLTRQVDIDSNDIPVIQFQKLNPTRYLVKVIDAKSPFILASNMKFDTNWEAKILPSQNPYKYFGKKVSSYFNESIIEYDALNNYIPDQSFSSSDSQLHIRNNEHFNGWIINKTGSYDILIEYTPQRLIYIGFIISLFVLFILLGVLFYLYKYGKN